MSQIAVVYWSSTGNTEAMAAAVTAGAEQAGAAVTKYFATDFKAAMVDDFDAIAFGCPSMGAEQLEETEFEPMFSDCTGKLSGKRIALFGSYGWGDGEWMREWENSCKEAGAVLVCDSVICMEAPDDEAEANCRSLGSALARPLCTEKQGTANFRRSLFYYTQLSALNSIMPYFSLSRSSFSSRGLLNSSMVTALAMA